MSENKKTWLMPEVIEIADVSKGVLKDDIVNEIKSLDPAYKDQVLKEDIYSVNIDDDLEETDISEVTLNFLKELRNVRPNACYFRLIN